jgi:hypothetical protein
MNNLLKSKNIQKYQIDRIIKSCYQTLYILDINYYEEDIIELVVSGSTLNLYKITINKDNIVCNCNEKKFNSEINIFCKHICFLICCLCKIYNELIFINKKISNFELELIKNKIKTIDVNSDTEVTSKFLFQKFKNINYNPNQSLFTPNKEINLEEECSICLKNFKNQKIVSCPTCKNIVHEECINEWINKNCTCIFCRSDIWKNFKIKKLN